MTTGMTRRDAAGAMLAAAAVLGSGGTASAAGNFRIILLGQSLIQHDLRQQNWDGMARFGALFAKADACFTDLETTIIGPNGGAVTRDPALLHRADASVLDCLSAMHVNLFATANNHAFDVGTGGVTDTMDAVIARKLAYAGTGTNLAGASAPGILSTPHGKVALVAMATGKIRDGGAATDTRPGVFEIRQDKPGAMNEVDVNRFLASIQNAARQAPMVIAYNHNHYWETNIADTPAWQKALARRAIDAGATIFVSHGAPILQGIEIYRGKPIFYDLGNFLYQSPDSANPYGSETWRSVIADCSFNAKGLVRADLIPITLNPVGVGGATDFVTKGRPSIATGDAATSTLEHLADLCAPFGTRLRIRNGLARLEKA
jgi:poly-gamma-glutamate capsule biosynthesis protein CapA/YwtB (metallophosphatase superfamily)